MKRSFLVLLMILLTAPAWAGSRSGGGFHGVGQGSVHHDGFAFHRRVHRARDLFVVDGFGNCGFGFDCGVNDPGYGYGGGAGNADSGGGDSGGGYSGGGYVPDPVGAEIPAVTFPTSCWVRRAGYDSSGAYVGQVLIDLCHPSDRVAVTRVEARAKSTGNSATDGSGAPHSPQ